MKRKGKEPSADLAPRLMHGFRAVGYHILREWLESVVMVAAP
jgi:hypothetical protein